MDEGLKEDKEWGHNYVREIGIKEGDAGLEKFCGI